MKEIKPVITEIYGVESRGKSIKTAFLDFWEYRVSGARIKLDFSDKSSSSIADLSIGTLMEEFKRGITEIYEV